MSEWPKGGDGGRIVVFDCRQIPVLREMVAQWIDEGFTTPPYTDEQYDIFEALDLFENPGLCSYDIRRPKA